MKVKWKMSLLVLLMGIIFSSNLLLFNFSLSYIDHLQEEKGKSLYLLSAWNDLMTATQKLHSAYPVLAVESEWRRKASEFDTRLTFFVSSQIETHSLREYDEHYKDLEDLQRLWGVIQEKFIRIHALYEGLEITEVPLTPLLVWNAQGGAPEEAAEIIALIDEFYPYQSSFSSSLQDMLYLIDRDIEVRTARMIRQLILVFIGITLLSLVLIFWYTQRLVGRFLRVEKAFSRISKGDFSGSLDLKGKDELGMMGGHFSQFMNVLRERLKSGIDIMHRVSDSVGEGAGLDEVYQVIIDAATETAGADAGMLLMLDEKTLVPRAIAGNFPPLEEVSSQVLHQDRRMRDFLLHTHYPVSGDSLYARVFREGAAFNLVNTEGASFPFSKKGTAQYISSLMILPLFGGGERMGVLAIAQRVPGRTFTDIETNHFAQFADFASITIENHKRYSEILQKQQIERDINIAADIQKKLLPDPIPELKRIDIAAWSTAAKVMSGDYYDVVKLSSDQTAVIICDVAGKGIPAALVMVMIRSVFRIIVSSARDPRKIIFWLNRGLCGSMVTGIFATLSVLVIDEKKRTVKYSNAAHHPMLVIDPELSEPEKMDTNGLPVGLEEGSRYEQKERALKPGTLLALYTDGVNEAPNLQKQEFSAKRIEEILVENVDKPVTEVRDTLIGELKRHTRGTDDHDDQTLLLLKIK